MILQSQSRVKLEQSANDNTPLSFQTKNQLSPPDYRFSHATNNNLNLIKLSKQSKQSVQHASDAQSFKSKRRKINPDKPKQKQLCQAILLLKKKLPMRSLEQVLIRLHQTVQAKIKMHDYAKEYVFAPEKRAKQEQKQNKSKIQESKMEQYNNSNQLEMQSTAYPNQNEQAEKGLYQATNHDNISATNIKNDNLNNFHNETASQFSKLQNIQNPNQIEYTLQTKIQSEPINTPLITQLPEAPPNYIYIPRDTEITVTYKQKDTHPVNFQSPEQEAKYIERKLVVQAFLERGYGFIELRDHILAEGYSFEITPNQYKSLAGGVAILALKKLESFLMYECGKMIVQFDRSQMRELCSQVLGCRATDSEKTISICKYLKAGVGMGDVAIGQTQSVNVYLSLQEFIHKKRVTMEALQKIGEQEYFKKMEGTLQLIKDKKKEKESKIAEKKMQRSNKFHIKKAKKQNKSSQSCHQDTKKQTQSGALIKDQDQTKNQENKSQSSPINLQEALALWTDSMDLQLIDIYLQKKSVLVSFRLMKGKHQQLQKWPPSLYNKKFSKIVKKAVRKVQVDSQLCENPTMPILNRLEKEELRKIIFSKEGEQVRTSLFEYYKQTMPNENQLANVANMTNMFVFSNMKNKTNEPVNHNNNNPAKENPPRRKRGRPFKNIRRQQSLNIDYQTIKAINIENRPINRNQEESFKVNIGRPPSNTKNRPQQIPYNSRHAIQSPSYNQENNDGQGIYFSDQQNQLYPENDFADIDVAALTFQIQDEWQ